MVRVSSVLRLFSLVLLLAVTVVMLGVSPAMAEEAANWEAVKKLVDASNNVSITLTENMTATSGLNIGGKTVTIDLNGHTITVDDNVGRLFDGWEGRLIIKDSEAIAVSKSTVVMPERNNLTDTTVMGGTGIGRAASYSNGVLTYYETTSAVKNTIATEETHEKVTVTVKGGIVRANQSNAELFGIGGGNASLTIEGGFFSNPTGRVANVNNGADVKITGGVFYGCNTNSWGGAIYVDSWTDNRAQFTISNAIFAGNTAASGGAVATNGKVDMFIKKGAVFSGNRATGSGNDGGGAIFVGLETVAKLEGGLITHNWCTDNKEGADSSISSYDVCGGGIMVRGILEMVSGQVTSNEAPGGGGISTRFWEGGVFAMRGGIVAGNVARLNEGGGITINMNGRGSITGGHITNNKAEGGQHWGGGGIFAANDSMLTMISTLITGNSAGGFGGGLAGCSTARVDTHSLEIQNHSVAIYKNSAEGENLSGHNSTKNEDHLYAKNDPVFMNGGYSDYFSALNTTVCGGFLGGGNANWAGTIDGEVIEQGDIKPAQKVTSQSVAGLTSHPEEADIAKAIAQAKVFVTGNEAYTHGGGILCNGYMIIGSHRFMEIGDRMTLVGDKTLSGGQLQNGQFHFEVTDADNNVLFTGTNNTDSEIIFNGRLTFEKAGTYIYKVREVAGDDFPENVIMDPTVYTIVVNVSATHKTIQAVDDEDITRTDVVDVTYNKITGVTVYRSDADEPVLHLDSIEKDDRSAYVLPGNVLQFVNRVSENTGFVVSKTVHDATNRSAGDAFEFTVTLSDNTVNGVYGDMTFTNGVAQFKLVSGQSKRAIDLPAGTTYSITEAAKAGYFNPNPTHNGTIVNGVVGSVVFENYAVGSLKVTKTVNSPNPDDETRDFDFRITLLPGDGRTGTYSGVTFTNGVAIVELKHGESITIENLPAGKEYIVEELTSEGFTVAAADNTGVIVSGQTQTAAFTNTRQTGELHVKKYVVDESGKSSDVDFNFKVTLTDAPNISGEFGNMEFKNGVAEFTLRGGETKVARGLPLGIHYRVSEPHAESGDDKHADYAVSIVGNESGAIAAAPSVVEFTNTKFAGLVISKETTGSALDRDKEFQFEITLKDKNGNGISETFSGVKFENGKATIYLKDGQSQVIEGLREDMLVTVTEKLEGEAAEHFIVQVNGTTVTGTPTFECELQSGHSAHAHFTNLHRVGTLEISKTTESPITEDQQHLFVFHVELSAPINGTFGDMFFTDGRATVYLKHGQKLQAENIPIGVTYKVTEQAENGFSSNHAQAVTGTISEAGAKIAYKNTRRLGGFKLTKTVQGAENNAENNDEEFGFKVILTPAYSGKFSDMNFVDGVAEFKLKDGGSIKATGLPEGTVYEIVETTFNSLHYVPVVDRIYGDITYDTVKPVNYINRAVSSLTVAKRVEGHEPDLTQKFEFTVILDNKEINATYGDMTFVNGEATFALAHGERKTATHLPAGTGYTVMETAADGYAISSTGASGTISTGSASSAVFVNTRKTGSLKVSKTVAGDAAVATDRFSFTVTLSDTTVNGPYGEMTFVDGVATFELGNGEAKTATGLPAGITYTVTEDAAGYTATKEGDAGTITAGATAEAKFTNTLNGVTTGSLTVSKTITGNVADMTKRFAFTVTLSDTMVNDTYGEMTFAAGVATFELGNGETKTATGLPAGITYTVTEDAAGYTATKEGDEGTITAGATAEAKFTNTLNGATTGSLTVSKTITGNVADMTRKFAFTVTLSDTTVNDTYGEMTFAAGVATFELGNDEAKTATGLPAGITYTVTEDAAGYTATKEGDAGTITAGATAEAKFTNTLNGVTTGDLKVRKTITGNVADMTRKFAFTVTLSDTTVSGTYDEMTFANGVATFELGNGESKTAKGLPAGLTYEVSENADGYTSFRKGDKGAILAGTTSEAAFRNDLSIGFGGLTVSKTVAGDAANTSERFTFTVTLNIRLNGTYGDMTFVDGVATFELGHNESKTANYLPEGTGYTVTEKAGGYTVSATGANGVIVANTVANARFVNSRSIARGSLCVTKTVTGEDGSKTQPFEFTVELTGANLNGTYGDMNFVNGVATFMLTDGQSKTAVGLPAGIAYRVTEKNGEYAVTKTGDVGNIPAYGTATAAFTNHLSIARGGLQVTKIITGNAADMTRKFSFRVTLDQPINGIHGGMTFVNGVATFLLGNGESAAADRLPAGVNYTVEELDYEDYNVIATGNTGTIAEGVTSTATFINERSVIDVPETGDHSAPAVYGILLLLSAAVLCLFVRKAKRI